MKSGKTLTELAMELDRQRNAKRDFVGPESRLRLVTETRDEVPAVKMVVADDSLAIQPYAHGQVANHLGIPKQYYDRMLTAAPHLLTNNVNYWMETSGLKRMVRTLDDEVRAYVSDRYRILDNYDLIEAVLPRISDAGGQVESSEITERRMYLKVIVPDKIAEIPPAGVTDWKWGSGHTAIDVVQPGIVLSNSEVGAGSLQVQPAIHTVRCTNLAVFRQHGERKYHVGRSQVGDDANALWRHYTDETRQLADQTFFAQMADIVTAALDGAIFDEIVTELRTARGMTFEQKPEEMVEITGNRFQLSETEKGGLLQHIIQQGENTQYALSNALTAMSQDVEDYERASDIERFGGTVIELQPSQWRELVAA